MEYTKGNWKVIQATRLGELHVTSSEPDMPHQMIADVVYDETNEPTIAELEANARLIAAAPELYEALKAVVSLYGMKRGEGNVAWQVLDAIAKAEGAE